MKVLTIHPLKVAPCLPVAFFTSKVKMGFPSPALDYHQDAINLNELLIKNAPATFIVQADGDSMMPLIPEHAMLIIDRSLQPQQNDIILAVVDGEFTVKHYLVKNGTVILMPANRRYAPITIQNEMQFLVWGVVSKIIIDPLKH